METYIEDGNKIVSYTAEELVEMRARGEDQSNWVAAKAMTEEEIQAAIAADPDDFEATKEDFANAIRSGHGGVRPGAGRPKGSIRPSKPDRRINVNVLLPPFLVQWLQNQPSSQGRLIEEALTGYFKIKV